MRSCNLFIIYIFLFSSPLFSHAQKDTLEKIFASKSFLLHEEYNGDWGGQNATFKFSPLEDGVSVLWLNAPFKPNERPHELKATLSDKQLKELKKLFVNCTHKIKTSKKGSTEHSTYYFTSKNINFSIDDKTTMECVELFKKWKEDFRAIAK